MNLQEKTILIDLDNPKQLYDFRLLNCRLFMQNNGHNKVFEKYCEFYNLPKTAERAVRFRYFWRGGVKDIATLEKYEAMINQLPTKEIKK